MTETHVHACALARITGARAGSRCRFCRDLVWRSSDVPADPTTVDRFRHRHPADPRDQVPVVPWRRAALSRLDLRTRESALSGGAHGAALVPGNAEQSRLYRMVAGLDQPAMPMQGTPLAAAQIAALKKWIDEGANWDAGAAMAAPASRASPLALENRPLTAEERGYWAFKLPVQAPAPVSTARISPTRSIASCETGAQRARLDAGAPRRSPDARAPRLSRPARAPAVAGRGRRSSWPIPRLARGSASSTSCWPRRTTASATAVTGSTWRAMPTPAASSTTSTGPTPGAIATT